MHLPRREVGAFTIFSAVPSVGSGNSRHASHRRLCQFEILAVMFVVACCLLLLPPLIFESLENLGLGSFGLFDIFVRCYGAFSAIVALICFSGVLLKVFKIAMCEHNSVSPALLLLVPTLLVFCSSSVPLFGWDALGFWGSFASENAKFLSEASVGSKYVEYIFPTSVSKFGKHHGELLPNIMMLASGVGGKSSNYWPMVWSIYVFLSAGFIWSFWRAWGVGPVFSSFGTYVLFGTPLMENHLLIHGYADMMLGLLCFKFSACVLFSLRGSTFFIWPIPIFIWSIVTLKNIGLAYIFIIALSFALANGPPLKKKVGKQIARYFPLALIVSLLIVGMVSGGLWGQFAIQESLHGYYITIGGARHQIHFDWALVMRAVSHALLINSSFNIVFLAWVLAIFGILFNDRNFWSGAAKFFFWLSVCILSFFVFILFLSETYRSQSIPGSDTGLSRQLLFLVFSVVSFVMLQLADDRYDSIELNRT